MRSGRRAMGRRTGFVGVDYMGWGAVFARSVPSGSGRMPSGIGGGSLLRRLGIGPRPVAREGLSDRSGPCFGVIRRGGLIALLSPFTPELYHLSPQNLTRPTNEAKYLPYNNQK